MKILFWIAFVLTVAEFTASPVNVLRGSAVHLQRFREVRFPLPLARTSAVIELAGLAAVLAGIKFPAGRLVGGCVLAAAFIVMLPWAIKAKRPVGDLAGLGLFIATALVVALY